MIISLRIFGKDVRTSRTITLSKGRLCSVVCIEDLDANYCEKGPPERST